MQPYTTKNILYPELSYILNGIFFKVHNKLGRFRNEKQYADAIENLLHQKNISFQREYALPVSFAGESNRRNIVDFLVQSKIILEIKAKEKIEKSDYFQTLRYLTSGNYPLAVLVNFRRRSLAPKRVINSGYSDK